MRSFKESINGHEATELTGATAPPTVATEPADPAPTPVA